MLQRLLRGWACYALFGLLVLFLYWRAGHAGTPQLPPVTEPVVVHHADTWWPESMDAATLTQRVAAHPSLSFAVSMLTVFIVGMVLGGIILTLRALAVGRRGSIWRFPSHRVAGWSFGECARILLVIVLVASLMPFVRLALLSSSLTLQLDTHLWMTLSMLALDLMVILTILTFAQGKANGRSLWQTMGFSRGTLAASIDTGFRGYLALFPWLLLLLVAIMGVTHALGIEPPNEPIQELIFDERRPFVLTLTFVLACVVGPIAEECFFRGVLYGSLRRKVSRLAAMLISAAAFALIHTSPIGFLPIMVLGCLLAYLYERTGSLASPLAIHILHNTFLLVLSMAVRQLTMASSWVR